MSASEHGRRVVQVLAHEAATLAALPELIGAQQAAIERICDLILDRCSEASGGRLVVSGVGKAGLIGRKIAATFASTGTPALFLHPTEALHGDLGMVRANDVALLLSNSGASEELLSLVAHLHLIGARCLALTGRREAPLAKLVDAHLSIGEVIEACPLGLAPSSSTTALLALGDALALAVLAARSFTPEDYARFHPGGALGRKLLRCAQAMRGRDRVAVVAPEASVQEALGRITGARAGCAVLIDQQQQVVGLFSDGDLRRALSGATDPQAVLRAPVSAHATCPCTCIEGERLLADALHLFTSRHFDDLPVVDAAGRLIGILDHQDLGHRGLISGPSGA